MMRSLEETLCLFAAFAFLTDVSASKAAPKPHPSSQYLVYVGTYTKGESKGIYAYRFDAATAKIRSLGLAAEVVNPSWITMDPNDKYLYAVSELGNDGKTNGFVTSFAIQPQTGALTFLNKVSSGGGGACHLAVDETGKMLVVANYGSGSVAAFPIQANGQLGERSALLQHKGSSIDPHRQRGPHAHAVVLSADNRFLFVPDLGLDKVFSYRLEPAKASIAANDPPSVSVKPGLGPRHFVIHPDAKFAYVLNEMGSRVTAFTYDREAGSLKEIQTISTLPDSFKGENNSAELEIDRGGRFLYASNRGDDSIAVFSVDSKTGKLDVVEHVPTQGKTPRSIKLDPSGKYLFAANQDSNNVVIFRVNAKSGRLQPTGEALSIGSPVCIQFVPAPA